MVVLISMIIDWSGNVLGDFHWSSWACEQLNATRNAVLGHTVWHEIFAGSNFCKFCRFSNDSQKLDPVKINSCGKKKSEKIYSLYLDY